MPAEPQATALLFATVATLIGGAVLFTRWSERLRVPLVLAFLMLGMVAGSDGVGGLEFDDYGLAYRLGSLALVFILFDGGMNTPMSVVRARLAASSVLATVGVAGTALLVALAAMALGLPRSTALLLGAVVSSTDAAAVFSVLRSSGIQLKRRVGGTLEIESGINDPMAVILTVELTLNLMAPGSMNVGMLLLHVGKEFLIGAAVGVAIGYGGRAVLARVQLTAGGLYPVFTIALALLAFGLPTLLGGSGFLAVYVAALVLGDGPLPYRAGLLRVHDAIAWLAQVMMFLMLGLLVYPSRLLDAAYIGTLLALFLAFVARPAVVAVCLAPFGYTVRDVIYVGWVGLRGAVPIVLATYPVLAGAPGAEALFNIVFFIVGVSAILPGATVPWVTRRLGLESADPPRPPAVLEIESMRPLGGRLLSFYMDPEVAATGSKIADLPFPDRSSVALIVRGDELIAPRGHTSIEAGDFVYVIANPHDLELIQLIFGRPSGE